MTEDKKDYMGFDKDIWPQIQFHNERVYDNFKLFIQITLAICGGLAYLSINKVNQSKELLVYLIHFVAKLQIIIGLYFSIAIFMHVLSQIRRYENKNNLFRKAILWLEPYMILFIIVISGLVAWTAYSKIATTIITG